MRKIDIRTLADYVLLNAYSIKFAGLYSGKAGVSLSLFCLSHELEDSYMEDHAVELLEQSIVGVKDDISFENGQAGVGFLIAYLIENRLIDADFDDLFIDQYSGIISKLTSQDIDSDRFLIVLRSVCFLWQVNRIKPDPIHASLMEKIFKACEKYLYDEFGDFNNLSYNKSKVVMINIFTEYLRLVNFCRYEPYSRALLSRFVELYRGGFIASQYSIGYSLGRLSSEFSDVAKMNIQRASQGALVDCMTLNQRIDMLYILHQFSEQNSTLAQQLEDSLFGESDDQMERNLISILPSYGLRIGYENGISRLLVYLANCNSELLSM